MASQESIIRNIEAQIKDILKNKNKADDYEKRLHFKQLQLEREILREKHNQLDALFKIHEGILPKEVVHKLSKDPVIRSDNIELTVLKDQAASLLQQVEHLSKTLEDVWIHDDVHAKVKMRDATNKPAFDRREYLKREIDRAQEKSQRLEMQLVEMSKTYSEQIADLKKQVLEASLQKPL